jgi:hypothetical protein
VSVNLFGLGADIADGLVDRAHRRVEARQHVGGGHRRQDVVGRRERVDRAAQRQVLKAQRDRLTRVGVGQEGHVGGLGAVQEIGAVEHGAVDDLGEVLEDPLEVRVQGLTRSRRQRGVLRRDHLFAHQLEQVRDRLARRQGDVRDRGGAIQAHLDRAERAHVGALLLGDRPDGRVVLRGGDGQARVDSGLHRLHVVVGAVQILQRDQRGLVRIDAQRHARPPIGDFAVVAIARDSACDLIAAEIGLRK